MRRDNGSGPTFQPHEEKLQAEMVRFLTGIRIDR